MDGERAVSRSGGHAEEPSECGKGALCGNIQAGGYGKAGPGPFRAYKIFPVRRRGRGRRRRKTAGEKGPGDPVCDGFLRA